jgi:D-tagatose-1,6-bisphosphate aldolase subunit GatZ/KbaZ
MWGVVPTRPGYSMVPQRWTMTSSGTKVSKWVKVAQERKATLLAVCPVSEAALHASLQVAADLRFPLLLAATLNQVDRDEGYTGLTPSAFTDFVRRIIDSRALDVEVAICLDHGGPFQKDAHVAVGLSATESTEQVKLSIDACVAAGYDLLHIDATRGADVEFGMDEMVDSTVALIGFAEASRKYHGRNEIDYEVGSDEVDGGVTEAGYLTRFLSKLRAKLEARGLSHVWPLFVVARLGTNLHTRDFDLDVARALAKEAAAFGVRLKGHYTDFVATPDAYAVAGVGGANIGPELAYEELRALREMERQFGVGEGMAESVTSEVRRALDESGRLAKWLEAEEVGRSIEGLEASRAEWLLGTGSRYVWSDPRVRHARIELYKRAGHHVDARLWVEDRLSQVIRRYVHAFRLEGYSATPQAVG